MRIRPFRRLFRAALNPQLAAIDFLQSTIQRNVWELRPTPRNPLGLVGLSLLALTAGHNRPLTSNISSTTGSVNCQRWLSSAGVFAISLLLVFLHRFRRHYILTPLVCAVVAGRSSPAESTNPSTGFLDCCSSLLRRLVPLAKEVEHWKRSIQRHPLLKRRLAERRP